MDYRQKAKELIYKFYDGRSKDRLPLTIYWTSAIASALVLVDEVLLVIESEEKKQYWEEVKKVIEKY